VRQETQLYITLQQFLKREAIISTGGQAKAFLLHNVVLVNGQAEKRRGRKLRLNDNVTINNTVHIVDYI